MSINETIPEVVARLTAERDAARLALAEVQAREVTLRGALESVRSVAQATNAMFVGSVITQRIDKALAATKPDDAALVMAIQEAVDSYHDRIKLRLPADWTDNFEASLQRTLREFAQHVAKSLGHGLDGAELDALFASKVTL